MSLEDLTSTELILEIAPSTQPLANLAIYDPFLLRASLSPILRVQNRQVQNRQVLLAQSTTSEKKTSSESVKVNPHAQCYRCEGYEHLTSQYPSQTKTLLVKIFIEDVQENGLEVTVHQQDDDSDVFGEECEFNGCIRTLAVTNLTPSEDSAQLRVVRCILAQSEQVNNRGRTVIFQTCTKIEDNSCKVIADCGSRINAIASKLITTLGMKPVKHSNPYPSVQEMSDSHSVCRIHR